MILVAYDIADPKRLRKVAKLLESYGLRAQNSTFELDISESELKLLKSSLSEIVEEQEDKVFIYRISSKKKKSKRKGKRKNLWELIF